MGYAPNQYTLDYNQQPHHNQAPQPVAVKTARSSSNTKTKTSFIQQQHGGISKNSSQLASSNFLKYYSKEQKDLEKEIQFLQKEIIP
jgi:hypothetical protein